MRKLAVILAVLLAFPMLAENDLRKPAFMALLLPKTAASGYSWVWQETYEGTGYSLGSEWHEVPGSGSPSFDPDFSPALDGSQSLEVVGGGGSLSYEWIAMPNSDSNHIVLHLNLPTSGNVGNASKFTLSRVGAGTDEGKLWVRNGGGTAPYLEITHGSVVASNATPTVLSFGTSYWIWWRFNKGTGSDGYSDLYLSTTSTKPGSAEATITTGTATAVSTNFTIQFSASDQMVVDMPSLLHTPIGNGPF